MSDVAMRERLREIQTAAQAALASCATESELEDLRVRFLGRKGELTQVVRQLREVPPAERPVVGALLNEIKDDLERRITDVLDRARAAARARRVAEERQDVTIPGRRPSLGHIHPITQVLDELIDIFAGLGFSVAEGPDVEDDYHNFEALNFPPDHPARDMQDTFFVTDTYLLRTHTSPVQIRVMEAQPPPLRVIVPGTVYRHDSDVTHSPMFHQLEGFMVDRHVTFADLKGVLTYVLQRLFGADTPVRLRPSFFPFTEPSAEIDIGCFGCPRDGSPCHICKGTGWVEILGSGMIDPNVFAAVGYDPEAFSGFAFGLGIERVAMLMHAINDIKLLFGNDLRFLRQF
jgi:phenylalanyl-tRNA synthetase alpha chain